MENKRQIVWQSVLFTGSRYIEEAINAIRGFTIAFVLGPEGYGIWHIIKIVYMLGEQAGLGTTGAMVREVAYYNSPSPVDKALVKRYQQTALTFGFAFSTFVATLGLIAYLQFFGALYPTEAILTAIAFFLSFSYLFARSKLQSENQLIQIVKISLGFVILNSLIGLSLLIFMSLQGLLLGVILSYLSVFLFLVFRKRLSIKLYIDFRILKKLLTIGLPMLFVSISGLLAYRVDSIIVYSMLGEELTGYYGLAVFIVIIISNIPNSISYVIFPKMMQDMKQKGEADVVARYIKKATVAVLCMLPLLLGLIFINIKPMLTLVMNEYVAAVFCLQILIIGMYFFSLQNLYATALIAMDKQLMVATIQGVIVSVGGLVDVLVILAGYSIEGVAIATALTFYTLFISTAVYAMVNWGSRPKKILLSLAALHLKFLYFLGSLWFVMWVVSNDSASILTSLHQSVIYVLFTIPLLILEAQKEFQILQRIIAMRNRGK